MSNNKDWTGNWHSLLGAMGSHSLFTTEEREENDYYATDPIAMEWLIKLEDIAPDVWEPACGEGHLAKVLTANGYNVKATDLIDRGYGTGGVDFFDCNETFEGDIITNPPYKYAQEFVEHALDVVPDGHKVIMFLKITFLEGKKRKLLFDKYPPKTIWISRSRIPCGRNGDFTGSGSMVAYAWYVWEKGYTGEPVIKWFN